MALPKKERGYGYPRDVQTEVWKQWFEKRNEKNTIIKMNTGSGKTVVGLTILQSCLNEKKGPAVYIAPDNYLVQQVCSEAEKLGIRVASDIIDDAGERIHKGEEDYLFLTGKAVFVTNIHKLINGKSVFGMRGSNNVKIGSVVVDDVHACLDAIVNQHTIFIESTHRLYGEILEIFSRYKEINDRQAFRDIIAVNNPRYNFLIPFWVWQKESDNIYSIINDPINKEESFVLFNLPLLKDNWKTINCVVSTRGIEMTLKGIPIDKFSSFAKAERRIFMSATLADDSVLVSTMGLKPEEATNIITPEKANDIGERLILFPKLLNAQITEEEIKFELHQLSQNHNVVVIVPSFDRVAFWSDVNPNQVLSSRDKNIESGVARLRNKELVGLTVLVNKYDGIDLPDDACRILVIDGLPRLVREYDAAIYDINPNDQRLYRETIQKIEQGMGRGIRSNNDYCVVVLMGDKLTDSIINYQGDSFFSSATKEQLALSKQLWDQLIESDEKPSAKDVFSLSQYVLNRHSEWVTANRSALSDAEYDCSPNIDSIVVALRNAFEQECLERYDEACSILQAEIYATDDPRTKGLLMQYMAEYMSFNNPSKAQEILLSARNYNSRVLKPIDGVQIDRLCYPQSGQAACAIKYYKDSAWKANEYIVHVDAILNNLVFSNDPADRFEQALADIGTIIGIASSRPEREYGGKAPDNLFALGNSEYAIIECKSGSTADQISKRDCGQLLQSIEWFKNLYKDPNLKCHPILVHSSAVFSSDASPSKEMRIMTPQRLTLLCNAVGSFAKAIVQDNANSTSEVERILNHLKLKGKLFVNHFTEPYRQARS